MRTTRRVAASLLAGGLWALLVAGAATASSHCDGGDDGGSVPLLSDWMLALLVGGVVAVGVFTLKQTEGRLAGGRTAVLVMVLAVSLMGVQPAQSGTDCDPPQSWTDKKLDEYHESNPTHVDWWYWSEYKGGRDKTCGPDSSGDGWFCSDAVPNGVRYIAGSDVPGLFQRRDNYCGQLTFGIHRSATETGTKEQRDRSPILWRSQPGSDTGPSHCSYPDNTENPDPSLGEYPHEDRDEWITYEFFEGGYYWGSLYTLYYNNGDDYTRNSPTDDRWYRVNAEEFLEIDTVGNDNISPVAELLSPIGENLHRQGNVEHVQTFELTATDEDGHDWTAKVELKHPDGVVETFALNGDALDEYSDGETVTFDVEMPHKDGTYEWRAKPTDTSGESNAEGNWTAWATFNFTFNLPPEIPNRQLPEAGAQVPEGQPVSFVIDTIDPEEDPYEGTIQVRKAGNDRESTWHTFETTPATSGESSVGQLDEVLSPGNYEWRASGTDVLVSGAPEQSDFNATWRTFTVSRTVSNESPAPPTLVAPLDGHSFSGGDPQDFTINATDPEGDDYLGVVTATNVNTGEETRFTTEQAASGQDSSGSPPVPLEGGDYEWSATAVDVRGASSDPSSTRTFSVSGAVAPGAPSLKHPGAGHEFAHNDVQRFVVNAVDPQGEPYQAEVRVDGTVVCETSPTPSGEDATCGPYPPVGPGSHSWDARASDPQGHIGPWSATAGFTVLDNRAPGAPNLVRPADSAVFATGEPQVFAVNATDPDGDSYHGEITATDVDTNETFTFETAESASDSDSYGSPTSPLPPGEYTWSATAVDLGGARSGSSASRSLIVNRPPQTPTLVSPGSDRTFGENEPQVFTINTTDPDGDPYQGRIEFRDPSTLNRLSEHDFETLPAASGEDSSGSPSEPLPPGDYEWRASAFDTANGESASSAWRAVSVHDGSTTTSSSTTTTTAPPGSQAAAGPVTGRVELDDPGLPPIFAPCESTSFLFTSNATGVAFDIDGSTFAGQVSINGTGGSACENAASGEGSLSVSASGFGFGGGSVDCPSLEGGFDRMGSYAEIVLRGDCTINDTATSPVVIRTSVNFRPDDLEASVSGRVMAADFEGTFTMEPA